MFSFNCCFLTCIHVSQETDFLYWQADSLLSEPPLVFYTILNHFLMVIYLYLATPSLSCSMQGLQSALQHEGPLIATCGIYFPNQGLNPGPLYWEYGVLVTGLPRKSLCIHYLSVYLINICCTLIMCLSAWDIVSQFSHSVMSDSLWPFELQYARPPCTSPTPGSCSNSCQSRWWWHPNISSSVVPFSSCPQSFPASGSFQMSQFFASGSQSIEILASA